MVINNDGAGNVENQPPATFDAATDGIDFYESLEGMRVQVNNARVVGQPMPLGKPGLLAIMEPVAARLPRVAVLSLPYGLQPGAGQARRYALSWHMASP